jgi:hypothetical protein
MVIVEMLNNAFCAVELYATIKYIKILSVAQYFYGKFMLPATLKGTYIFT